MLQSDDEASWVKHMGNPAVKIQKPAIYESECMKGVVPRL